MTPEPSTGQRVVTDDCKGNGQRLDCIKAWPVLTGSSPRWRKVRKCLDPHPKVEVTYATQFIPASLPEAVLGWSIAPRKLGAEKSEQDGFAECAVYSYF